MPVFLKVLVLFCFLQLPVVAAAQGTGHLSEEDEARIVELVESARKDYNQGFFQESLEKFQQAYELLPHPDLLYRIALSHERLGNDEQAVRYYREFLRQVPDAPESRRIQRTIEVIEGRLAPDEITEIHITTEPEGAIVYLNDVTQGARGYTPTRLPVPAGSWRVIVKKEGYRDVEEMVDIRPGETFQVRYQLVKDGSQATVVQGPTSSVSRVGPALMILGSASLIATLIFFNQYVTAQSELDTMDRNPSSYSLSRYQEVRSKRNWTMGLSIAGAVVTTASFLLGWQLWSTTSMSATAPHSTPPHGQGVGVFLTW